MNKVVGFAIGFGSALVLLPAHPVLFFVALLAAIIVVSTIAYWTN